MSSPVTWNPVRQLWETEQADLFSGQQEPFSETWPTSGMTRSGRLLPLPMSGHRIGGNESSLLLPTPTSHQDGSAADLDKRQTRVDAAKAKHGRIFGQTLEVAIAMLPSVAQMLPTPRATDGTEGGPNQRGSSGDLMLPSAVMNLE